MVRASPGRSRGTTVVVAAGNGNADAANFSPADRPGVIAVGSNGITGPCRGQ
jgi:serine protease